jgi:hypothetical protein
MIRMLASKLNAEAWKKQYPNGDTYFCVLFNENPKECLNSLVDIFKN